MSRVHLARATGASALVAALTAASGVAVYATGSATGTRLVSAGDVDRADAAPNVFPSLSREGRMIAFQSFEDGLINGDANGTSDILVRDMSTGAMMRASVDAQGRDANGPSTSPAISPDGRYVVFSSDASDLVRSDTNGVNDIFLRDLTRHRTIRISVGIAPGDDSRRVANPSVSNDGKRVAFQVSTGSPPTRSEVYVRDVEAHRTWLASVAVDGGRAQGNSLSAQISPGGRFVAFLSSAENLVAHDGNGFTDVFRRDLATGRTVLVSRDRFGGRADADALPGPPAISAGGRYVVFHNQASDLVPNDTNGEPDVFRRDLWKRKTLRVSVTSAEEQVSGFGSFHTVRMGISGDGCFVTFSSDFTGLTANDRNGQPDVFLRDVRRGTTRLVSVNLDGRAPVGFSINPSISLNGRFVGYNSEGNGITSDDTDDFVDDVFRRHMR